MTISFYWISSYAMRSRYRLNRLLSIQVVFIVVGSSEMNVG
jgi:hypothetical protein